jgi:molybdate transport system regulatory protein
MVGVKSNPAETLNAALMLRRGASRVGAERVALLEAVAELGSISGAARKLGLSYKGAWDAVQALNNLFDQPVIAAQAGGARGGTATVTPRGEALIKAYGRIQAELDGALRRLGASLAGEDADVELLVWSLGMRTSARNALRGVVKSVTPGAVNAEVILDLGEGLEIVAVVTLESVHELDLEPGRPAMALIKSSFVILATGEGLRTSARNQLPGRVVRLEHGEVSSEVVLALAGGKTLTAMVTRQSAETLGLEVGAAVTGLVKAPHVILATP